jgi:photosystem II stability/assembly factor-like uncharacterized protein
MKMRWIVVALCVALAGCDVPISPTPPTNSGDVMVAVGAGGSIARSLDHGATWETSMSVSPEYQKKFFKRTNVTIDGDLTITKEINGGLINQIQSASKAIGQLNTAGFQGDLYVRGHVYQALGEAWSGLIANPFGATGISSISYGNGVFVAVGVGGKIARSTDLGATWGALIVNNFAGVAIESIAFGNNVFVAVSQSGTISRSTDFGVTWSALLANPFLGGVIQSVSFGNGVFVAVGNNGKIARSVDSGATWGALIGNPWATAIISVAFGNGAFVAVGLGGTIARSSDLGITWGSLITNPFGGAEALNAVGYGNSVFVVVSGNGNIARSVDLGLTWGSFISNPYVGTDLQSISYNYGIFIVGGASVSERSVDNGLTWQITNLGFGFATVGGVASSPQTTSGTGNMVAVGAAGSIATTGWIGGYNFAPLPQTAAGVGQVVTVNSGLGNAAVYGSGGMWWGWCFGINGAGAVIYGAFMNIQAGGSTLAGAIGGTNWQGFMERIA